MKSNFSKRVTPFIESELVSARRSRFSGDTRQEFVHLERAHVVGQESTYWHVKIHVLMLLWGFRNRSVREVLGQVFRIIGAVTKTAIGLVPQGNTGGANVSPFKRMPIAPDLAAVVRKAKSGA